MSKPKVLIFIGSVRENRNADRVCTFVKGALEAHFEVKVIDPKALNLPLIQLPIHFYPDPSKAPKVVQDLNADVKSADAFVFLTAEYNRGAPPALINTLDHASPGSYAWKAGTIISYSMGPTGGNLAPIAIMPTLKEFGVHLIPVGVSIGTVEKVLNAEGALQPGNDTVKSQVDMAVGQLVWLTEALKAAREKKAPPKSQFYLRD